MPKKKKNLAVVFVYKFAYIQIFMSGGKMAAVFLKILSYILLKSNPQNFPEHIHSNLEACETFLVLFIDTNPGFLFVSKCLCCSL